MKKRIILIMGDLAAGKSSYAKHISKKLNIPYFLKDTLKEILSDTIGYNNREENLKLSCGAFSIMKEISKRLMEKNQSFILESNFKQKELDELSLIIDYYQYESLIIWLQGDIKILHQRYLNRIKDGRHQTHLVVDLKEFDDFYHYTIENRNRIPFGNIKVVNVDSFFFFDDESIYQ